MAASVSRPDVVPTGSVGSEAARRRGGSSGQVLVTLPEEARHAVRVEIRRDLRDTGGPIDIEVEFRIASRRR